jgi:hypothetical protein
MMSEPMSDERLGAVLCAVQEHGMLGRDAALELLAEVDRLRALVGDLSARQADKVPGGQLASALTVRQYYAARAMQGLAALDMACTPMARAAWALADALIATENEKS